MANLLVFLDIIMKKIDDNRHRTPTRVYDTPRNRDLKVCCLNDELCSSYGT